MPHDVPPLTRIFLIQLRQDVVGAFATRLAELLEEANEETPVILDFAQVTSIDGYGINVIAETLTRGVRLYMVGVRGKVRRMFRQARAISAEQFVPTLDDALRAIDHAYQPEPPVAVERRSSPRIRSHIPVEVVVTIDGRRVPTEGIIKDISQGGIYVELAQYLAEEQGLGDDFDLKAALDLRFALPDVAYPCLVEADAVHHQVASANLYCGVRFKEISYLDEDAIRLFLYRHDPDHRAGSS